MVKANDRKSFKCQHCSKCYSNKSYLKRHKCYRKGTDKAKSKAKAKAKTTTDTKISAAAAALAYTCKWCNQQFCDSAQLVRHVSQEHGSLSALSTVVPCIICHKEFTNAPALLLHLREHVQNGDQHKQKQQ